MTTGEHASAGGSAWSRLLASDGFRRVVRTFGIAFLGLLIPGALGWLHALTEWSLSQGQAPLPDAHSLAYMGITAISAGFIAVLNGIVVGTENAAGKGILRDVPPE